MGLLLSVGGAGVVVEPLVFFSNSKFAFRVLSILALSTGIWACIANGNSNNRTIGRIAHCPLNTPILVRLNKLKYALVFFIRAKFNNNTAFAVLLFNVNFGAKVFSKAFL